MYKITADGVLDWRTTGESLRILIRGGATQSSAEATLKAMRGMGRDFYRPE